MPGFSAAVALTFQAIAEQQGAPPIEGLGALLTFLAFLVVMLVVPCLMARDPSTDRAGPADAETAGPGTHPGLTSDRERRLWMWTALVLAAIYTTLGPAAELAAALREWNLLRISSAAILLLVISVFAVPWLKKRPGRFEVGAAAGILAVYLTTLIRIPVPEARSHLFEYGLVAMLIYQALLERRRNGRPVPAPPLIAWAGASVLGLTDELIQAYLPNRTYDLVDVGFNAIAACMAIAATMFMTWARSWDVLRRVREARGNAEP